jgi:hypothetical protein
MRSSEAAPCILSEISIRAFSDLFCSVLEIVGLSSDIVIHDIAARIRSAAIALRYER